MWWPVTGWVQLEDNEVLEKKKEENEKARKWTHKKDNKKDNLSFWNMKYIYIYIYTHTHTHIYKPQHYNSLSSFIKSCKCKLATERPYVYFEST